MPDRRVNPQNLVELSGTVAADIENAYLRPVGVRVDVEIVDSRDAFAIHNSHIFRPDCYQILDTDVGKIVFEKHERLLTQLRIDTGLCVGREPLEGSAGVSRAHLS